LYSRFVKEILQAVDINHDGRISFAELRQLLKNIGVTREKMSDEELLSIFNELGRSDDEIDADSGAKLIWVEDVEAMLLSSYKRN
jgi:Ca2+-binding EF-hand superfamily protein